MKIKVVYLIPGDFIEGIAMKYSFVRRTLDRRTTFYKKNHQYILLDGFSINKLIIKFGLKYKGDFSRNGEVYVPKAAVGYLVKEEIEKYYLGV